MFKKIIKYLFYGILSLLFISFLIISALVIRYKNTVNVTSGQMQVPFQPGELGQWVDPFIGTGGFPVYTSADDIPGATVPFGMVRLSPDTKYFLDTDSEEDNTVSTGGYYYGDNKIMGFSHIHQLFEDQLF
ncbi:MAG: hypothetical protein L3J11_06305 [Draconibacterium sp.]|nr:hypothetical protein [Draconibacterium sp.]